MNLIVLVLATYRLSYMLLYEDGPNEIFLRIREKAGIFHQLSSEGELTQRLERDKENIFTEVLLCIKCFSVWVGVFFTIIYYVLPEYAIWFAFPFALSAGVLLIDKFIDGG